MIASSAEPLNKRSLIDRNLRKAKQDEIQNPYKNLRHDQYEFKRNQQSLGTLLRLLARDMKNERSLQLRENETDIVISISNEATTSVRLILFCIRSSGQPYLVDSNLILMNKNELLTVPSDTNYMKVIVEKYAVDEMWHVAYSHTTENPTNLCLVVTGTTLDTSVHECTTEKD
ncbi:unnamed protein product [Rotaria socialis]|uniref:Uncharacterized protein n=1 Tax=Rotaria socialis TaxID=392032 RepID=A0A817KTQ1_9BILA|nr:unnamed protein product [Rotaria socialis]CAF3312984.1 unnamed protein product [Rotaria socialis]CAF4235228.1 unnamed protein product [Rotaria socialis]CAF4527887.1 unnamed protein product [Rotaria socialis]